MKRGLTILASLCVLIAVTYISAAKWLIRHETLTFYDAARQRPVELQIAVRRDTETKANAGLLKLPVAILNPGEGIGYTDYTFLADELAVRGYLSVSIRQELPTDDPLATEAGEPYAGRLPVYQRGVANILFVIGQLKKIVPNADYDHLTLVGHANGGDIAMYFAKLHPDQVREVVTLDNMHVPLATGGKFKILSFRSKSAVRPDPGVIPDNEDAEKEGITVVYTSATPADMSDRGSAEFKTSIQDLLGKYAEDDIAALPSPLDAIRQIVFDHLTIFFAFTALVFAALFAALFEKSPPIVALKREAVIAARGLLNQAARIVPRLRPGAKQPLHLSNYFARKSGKAAATGGGLIFAAFCYAVLARDGQVGLLLFALLLAVAARYWLTTYRASHGYLGTNAAEAEELIGFIIQQQRDGGVPPDLRKYSVEDLIESEGDVRGIAVGGAAR
jgi:pimeloyl-ACP methyl ester carboxylesterase